MFDVSFSEAYVKIAGWKCSYFPLKFQADVLRHNVRQRIQLHCPHRSKIIQKWGLCSYIIVDAILPPSPVILWIELGGKPKWLPLHFGYHDVMCMAPIEQKEVIRI